MNNNVFFLTLKLSDAVFILLIKIILLTDEQVKFRAQLR